MAQKTHKRWPEAEVFVKTWQQADSLDAAARKLDTTRAQASIQATYLRRQGVPLKKFHSPGRPAKDYDNLKALARKLSPEIRKPERKQKRAAVTQAAAEA